MNRRHDLDNLRIIAFFVLIFYHIGMYYVLEWGWHIKSETTYRWLQELMVMTNPWRMSLLFFISAMALSLVAQKYTPLSLLKMRFTRLLIPLLFGMYFIVAPQAYIEGMDRGLINMTFIDFWLEYIDPQTTLLPEQQSSIALLTWNHLWFLPYLFVYSAIVLCLSPLIKRFTDSEVFKSLPIWAFLATVILLMLIAYMQLRIEYPSTHGLTDDWYNHAKYFSVFVAGYLLAQQQSWWNYIIDKRFYFLVIALAGYIFIVADRNGIFAPLAALYTISAWVKGFYGTVFIINHWAWILAALGLAGKYLTKTNRFATYANEAILPWYILHQTLIVIIAYSLKPFGIAPQYEWWLVLSGTLLACYLGFELIKRTKVTRLLFGLKLY
jgi:peptidoglycan/LPS O-acetylase OafA/YrhL